MCPNLFPKHCIILCSSREKDDANDDVCNLFVYLQEKDNSDDFVQISVMQHRCKLLEEWGIMNEFCLFENQW